MSTKRFTTSIGLDIDVGIDVNHYQFFSISLRISRSVGRNMGTNTNILTISHKQ